MEDKPKRRFWQLHLSTSILLTLVIGGFVFLNSVEYEIKDVRCFGWPWTAHDRAFVIGSSWNLTALTFDVLLALSVCAVVVITFEYVVRRFTTFIEPTTPTRKCCHIHLSTFVILMMLCGFLMFKNIHRTDPGDVSLWGWPMPMLFHFVHAKGEPWEYFIMWNCVSINAYVSFVILFFPCLFSEHFARRREARKQ